MIPIPFRGAHARRRFSAILVPGFAGADPTVARAARPLVTAGAAIVDRGGLRVSRDQPQAIGAHAPIPGATPRRARH